MYMIYDIQDTFLRSICLLTLSSNLMFSINIE